METPNRRRRTPSTSVAAGSPRTSLFATGLTARSASRPEPPSLVERPVLRAVPAELHARGDRHAAVADLAGDEERDVALEAADLPGVGVARERGLVERVLGGGPGPRLGVGRERPRLGPVRSAVGIAELQREHAGA